ncbi:MAG TPA: DUF4412 domain-containing protein [Thermoanaerobaculia bacterium]|nr:DUF4412 domain-containing protein [Thermoanaerobaculia bacterium]
MDRRALTCLALLLTLSIPAAADTLLTVKSHVGAFQLMGENQPAKDTEVKIWVGADRLRRDEGQTSSILRLDRNKLYIVDHAAKTYSEVGLPVDLQKYAPAGTEAAMKQMGDAMRLDAKVTPASETRKIGDWNARRVDVAITSAMGMKIATTMWVSKDLEIYRSLNRMSATLASLQHGAAAWARQLEEIEGFPVLQESSISVVGTQFKTREELVAVAAQDAPAGIYEPPAGYTRQPFNPMAQPGR